MKVSLTLQRTQRLARSFVCLSCSLGVLSAFAGTSESDSATSELSKWLSGNNDPTSRGVSNAFHTSAPNPSAREAAKIHGPIIERRIAVYPNEFRTVDGKKNAIGDLGQAGTVDLRNVTDGYGDGVSRARRRGPQEPEREISNIVSATRMVLQF